MAVAPPFAMTLTYRPATEEDLPHMVRLLADDMLGEAREDTSVPLNERYITAFRAIDADPHNELIVVERDDHLVGLLQLTFIPYLTHTGSWRCLVEGIRIARAFRGQGLGRQMMIWAISQAKARGCRIVQLTSDKQRPDALRFYRSLGFQATHEGFKRLL